jgi:hypothetical protein
MMGDMGARFDIVNINRGRRSDGGIIAQEERLVDQKKGIAATEPGRGISDRVIDATHQQQQVAVPGAGESAKNKPTSERTAAATR